MIPTIQDVYETARNILGEDEITSGQVFSDNFLFPHLRTAYADMLRAYRRYSNLASQRPLFYVLPANTSHFRPSQAGYFDFGEPEFQGVKQRRVTDLLTISNIVPDPDNGLCRVTTSASHNLLTGADVILYKAGGISADINDEWVVTVISPTVFDLNGCYSTGTYTSGGFVSSSPERWQAMTQTDQDIDLSQAPSAELTQRYNWKNETFHFEPASAQRQIRVNYTISGGLTNVLANSLYIDDSLDYLAYRTAELAARSRGADQSANSFMALAIGPDGEADGSGGFLANLIAEGVKTLQQVPFTFRKYRERPNAGRAGRGGLGRRGII